MIKVKELRKHYPLPASLFAKERPFVRAVDGVSFEIKRGRTLGLVGESGSGKTTVGRVMLNLISPTSGEVLVDERNIFEMSPAELDASRRKLQIIFQDPYASLNPRMTVEDIVSEGMVVHGMHKSTERREKVMELLRTVGLSEGHIDRYPHEFSGGQRQRIGIARAISLNPEFVVCDEPVSALDVSIQAQIVNLLMDLQEKRDMAYLFISHDLAVVKQISHEVAVMFAGKIVEQAMTSELFSRPLHPYTQGLLAAVPSIKGKGDRTVMPKVTFETAESGTGCPYVSRCPQRKSCCEKTAPAESEPFPGHKVRCFLH